MPPNQYERLPTDTIELLSAEEQQDKTRHQTSESASSFIHYRTPQSSSHVTQPIPQVNTLASQAFPSLLISVIGLIIAGWMMDIYQHWDVFTKISELFILVPVLLNLKGNLEMNLASRFSTSAHMGDIDIPAKRNALTLGNLSLIQVQALIAGALAGLLSVALGAILHPDQPTTLKESLLVIVSSMVSASVSSLVLGVFMCALIILSRIWSIDPDNIACPMASSLGDVVTLGILAECAHLLLINIDTPLSVILLLMMSASVPFFAYSVWKNPHVKDLLFTGWMPILVAMLISSGSGLVLERYVEQYEGLAMLTPILCGLSGNLGSIYASRISTCLHRNAEEQFKKVEITLLLMNVPVQLVFLFTIWILDMGHLDFTVAFAFSYFFVSMASTYAALKMGKSMTLTLWKYKYNPDNYVLPYLTALIDVICTTLLVISFSLLDTTELAELDNSTQ